MLIPYKTHITMSLSYRYDGLYMVDEVCALFGTRPLNYAHYSFSLQADMKEGKSGFKVCLFRLVVRRSPCNRIMLVVQHFM